MSERPLKRRRVRKGTASCWECKRRKTRCTFASPSESVCDGCRSRQLRCISQQFYESQQDGIYRESTAPKGVSPDPSQPTKKDGYAHLRRDLLSAWPKQHELDAILSIPANTSVVFHGMICSPYTTSPPNKTSTLPSRHGLLALPLPDAHPVLIARKLLLLGTFLQGMPGGFGKALGATSRFLVETVGRLVTSNDDLVGVLEGIECLMIEAMYHNNAGNLRRAWVTHRRAMAIGQMLGLDRLAPLEPPQMIDHQILDRVDPEHMWFRLVTTDRYLSLILGLPQASPESKLGVPSALTSCPPTARMERIMSVAGGLILQRNKTSPYDVVRTREIDQLLQEAATLLPPRWWLIPDIAAMTGDGSEAFTETLRLMSQFAHYHLLAQLHLPYLLLPSNDRGHDYSKITTVTASRELLSRFVSFRSPGNPFSAYCRGVDFLAFIASTVLALAHIDVRRQKQRQRQLASTESDGTGSVLDFLAHQWPGDRGLLERTLESMEKTAQNGNDAVAVGISNLLRRLLVLEEGAANGGVSYTIRISSETGDPESLPGPESSRYQQGAAELRIRIPYFGTVSIEEEKDGTMPTTTTNSKDCQGSDSPAELAEDNWQDLLVPGLETDADEWALQGVELALFNNLLRGAGVMSAK